MSETEHINRVVYVSQTRSLSAPSALTPVTQAGCFNEYPRGTSSPTYSLDYLEIRQHSLLEFSLWFRDFPFFPAKRIMFTTRVRKHWLLASNKYTSQHPRDNQGGW